MVRKSAVGRKMPWKRGGYALFQAHQKIDNLPIEASLNRGPVGYVGPRPIVLEQFATPRCSISCLSLLP